MKRIARGAMALFVVFGLFLYQPARAFATEPEHGFDVVSSSPATESGGANYSPAAEFGGAGDGPETESGGTETESDTKGDGTAAEPDTTGDDPTVESNAASDDPAAGSEAPDAHDGELVQPDETAEGMEAGLDFAAEGAAFAMTSDDLPDPSDEDVVSTEEELQIWCGEHSGTGGKVTLAETIVIEEGLYVFGETIIIDTGPNGLICNGGQIYGNFEIQGEGVDIPVLDIVDMGGWRYGWNYYVCLLDITAYGSEGRGGTALRVSQGDGFTVNVEEMQYFWFLGHIRSYGTRAIGLSLAEGLDVYFLDIEVEGDGCTAVYAENGANLYYCKLKAEGNGATAVSGSGEIILDTCAALPEPAESAGVRVINRKILNINGSHYYVKQNDRIVWGKNVYTCLLSGDDEFPPIYELLLLDWDFGLDIDTSVLGRTVIPCWLSPQFQGLGLEDDFSLKILVDVRDPSIPCIHSVEFIYSLELEQPFAVLYFWDAYDRSIDNVILWRSDDGGQTWYDFSDSPDISWDKDAVIFFYNELTSPAMLLLEVLGKGESNYVTISSVDNFVYNGGGGDRTGTDRGGADKPGNDGSDDDTKMGDDENTDSGTQPGNGGKSGRGARPDNGGNPVNDTLSVDGDNSIVDTQPGYYDNPDVDTQPGYYDNPDVDTQPGDYDYPAVDAQPGDYDYPAVDAQPDATVYNSGQEQSQDSTQPILTLSMADNDAVPVFIAVQDNTPGEEDIFEGIITEELAVITLPPDNNEEARDIPYALASIGSASGQSAPAAPFDTGAAMALAAGAAVVFLGGFALIKIRMARR